MSRLPEVLHRPGPAWQLVATGTTCGFAWSAALRGWMAQFAGSAESTFTWYGTFGLQVAPGAVVGAAFGYAEYRRRTGGAPSKWLTLAPLVFLSALTVPWIFRALISSGVGGGAIGVTGFGLAGGYALSGRGRVWLRRGCGLLAVLGVALMAVIAGEVVPLGTAHGVWVGLLASSLMALLCVACAIPQRIGRLTTLPAWSALALGAVAGLAWSAALRAVMWEVARATGQVEGSDPACFVLLSGAVVGAVLGWAQWRRQSGPVPHRAWIAGTPMLLSAALLLWNLTDPAGSAHGGLGLSALAVPVIGVMGGYGLSGGGSRLIRAAYLLPLASCVPAWAYTATAVGSQKLSLTTPHGAWVAVLVWALLLTSAIAAGLPHRRSTAPPPAAPADGHTTTPAPSASTPSRRVGEDALGR